MPDNGVPDADDPPLVLPPELVPPDPEPPGLEPPELGCVAEPVGPTGLTGAVVVGEGVPPFDGAPTRFLGLVVGVGTIESPGRLGADDFVDAVVEAGELPTANQAPPPMISTNAAAIATSTGMLGRRLHHREPAAPASAAGDPGGAPAKTPGKGSPA